MITKQSPKKNMKPSSNKTDYFKSKKSVKKSTKDYGKITISALKRQKD